MNQIEQCPKCKYITEGYPVFETKRQVARTGGKWAIKKVLIYLLTPLICTILGPLGTISGSMAEGQVSGTLFVLVNPVSWQYRYD